jgi:hypothetical protein
MSKNLIEFNAYDADVVPYSGYNSNKTVLGPQIYKFTGSSSANYYIGPHETTFRDITQDTGTNHWGSISVIKYNDNIQWLFSLRYGATGGGGQSASDICMYEFNKLTYTYTYVGSVTCANAAAAGGTNHYGLSTNLTYYTAGTVQVSGTSVTGTSTDWIDNRIPIGARIGFGSNNPQDISTWYRISNYPLMNSTPSLLNGTVTAIAFDTSGNTFIGGSFTTYSGVSVGRLAKISSGGTLDTTFNTNIGTGLNAFPQVISVDSSGDLYVGGNFTTYSGVTNNRIIKLFNNGLKDTSFDNGSGGFGGGTVNDIKFDSVGKLYVGGNFTTYKAVANNYIIKLNTNGTKDTSFDNTTGFNTVVHTIAVAENNSIYVGGNFTTYKAVANNNIIKILSGGTKDTSFDNGSGGISGALNKIIYKQSTGSIIVGGGFTQWKGVSNSYLTEISSGGTALMSSRSSQAIYDMDIDSSDNLYCYANQIITKRNINTLIADPNFNPNIIFTTNAAFSQIIAVDPTETRLYVGSANATIDSNIVCVNTSDGEKTPNFITNAQDITSQVITLNSFAGTFPMGTPYVIENLMFSEFHQSYGVCLIQGLSKDDFTSTPTSIVTPALNYAGLSKGKYILYDGFYTSSNGYNTIGISNVVKDTNILTLENSSTQYLYTINTAGRVARYNIKNPLITQLGSGTQGILRYSIPSQLILTNTPIITPTGAAVAGSANGNLNIVTMQSGSASGITSLFTDSTGIVQTPISELVNEGVPLYTYMPEVPPGSTTTYNAAGNVGKVFYMPEIDKLIVLNASSTAKSYITKYQLNMIQPTLSGTLFGRETFANLSYNNSYDTTFLFNGGQLQGNTSNVLAPKYPDTLGTGFFGSVLDGTLHLCRPLATIQNNLYAVPMGCEALYVDYSNNVFITPKYTLPNVIAITGLFVNSYKQYGSYPFAIPPEPIVIHYRTTGITANTGTWTEFTDVQSLNDDIICDGVLNSIDIQFRFSYKVAGNTCLTNKIYGFSLAYEDDRTDSHYSPSVSKSSLSNRTFAWRQEQLWNSTIPDLRIRLYNATNSNIVFYDTVLTSASGTWEYSTDNGVTWLPWSSSADAVGNYIRYVADFIPVGIKLRVGLNRI